MNEITLAGNVYRIGKIDALTQFHVTRRLAPVLASLGVGVTTLLQSGEEVGDTLEAFLPVMGPVSEVLAAMSNEDVNYVIFACLSAVQRAQAGGKYAPVTTATNQIMFQDIDMVVMVRLTVEVMRINLAPFFEGLRVPSPSQSS
jgi:hypothetical protein